ncbi:protein of unknown function [Oenococcus oeni]|nr:hypothetical protein OENI_10069 [Oenococcus oeni]SYW02522.1 hypothetical protein OENI_390003 [Oenococcus oeni]SYW18926.1 hypothetical protein OENI_60071 [Oenococcus oeni]VDC13772.1 protein of unknown function [Oenococcus oeni]
MAYKMILNVLLMFSLFFAIYRVISHIFKFEKLTQLTSSVMPVYSLNMFFKYVFHCYELELKECYYTFWPYSHIYCYCLVLSFQSSI